MTFPITCLIVITLFSVAVGAESPVALDFPGCERFDRGPYLNCSEPDIQRTFQCAQVREANLALRNLTPYHPLIECDVESKQNLISQNQAMFGRGCGMFSLYGRYIMYNGEQYAVIQNATDFRNIFAPVDSEAEALAFAAAISGYEPKYDGNVPHGYVPMANEIRPTSVEKNDRGYKVRLFGYQCEGCGPHPYYFVDFQVTFKGDVVMLSRENVYRDPTKDDLCQD